MEPIVIFVMIFAKTRPRLAPPQLEANQEFYFSSKCLGCVSHLDRIILCELLGITVNYIQGKQEKRKNVNKNELFNDCIIAIEIEIGSFNFWHCITQFYIFSCDKH